MTIDFICVMRGYRNQYEFSPKTFLPGLIFFNKGNNIYETESGLQHWLWIFRENGDTELLYLLDP